MRPSPSVFMWLSGVAMMLSSTTAAQATEWDFHRRLDQTIDAIPQHGRVLALLRSFSRWQATPGTR